MIQDATISSGQGSREPEIRRVECPFFGFRFWQVYVLRQELTTMEAFTGPAGLTARLNAMKVGHDSRMAR
jgi:hypothetical protein